MPESAAPRDGSTAPRAIAIVRTFVVSFIILFGLTSLWSLASPLLSGPDENSHSIKAAGVAYGDPDGSPSGEGTRSFLVPSYFAQTQRALCYVFNQNATASCITDIDGSNADLVPVDSTAGAYNNVYYALVGWPSLLLEDEAAYYGMRVASAALVGLLLASGFTALLARSNRGWGLMGGALAMTPMVTFLGGVVNPSSLEIAAGFALAAWLALLTDRGRPTLVRLSIIGVAVSAALLLNTRSVGLLWTVVILIAFLIETRIWGVLLRRIDFWIAVGVIAIGAAYGAWWTLSQGAAEARGDMEGMGEITFAEGFEFMLSKTMEFAQGYIGIFGWLDTPLPQTSVNLWGGLMVVFIGAALLLGRGWAWGKLVFLVGAAVLIPALLQGSQWYELGYIWQARYLLAIIAALLVCAGLVLDDGTVQPRQLPRPRIVVTVLLGLLVVVHAFGFILALKRYSVGHLDGDGWTMVVRAPQWEPPGGILPLFGLYLLLLAAAWLLLARAVLRRPALDLAAPLAVDGAPRRSRRPSGRRADRTRPVDTAAVPVATAAPAGDGARASDTDAVPVAIGPEPAPGSRADDRERTDPGGADAPRTRRTTQEDPE